MKLRLLCVGLALVPGLALAADPRDPQTAQPPMTLPQARIDSVDTAAWPHVRVLATVLDASGRPVQPKALKRLAVIDAKKASAAPYVLFRQGKPDEAFKGAKLQTRDKAAVPLAAVVVVAGYQHESLRQGSLGQRLKEALSAGWKQFAKGDRVNAVWYGDRLYRFHALKGRTGELDDVETRQRDCATALAEARAEGPLSLIAGSADDKDHPPPPPGTWLCGLQDEPKTVGALVKTAPFKGYFPRLFGLGAPFYEVGRYCAPPPEGLEGFGQFTAANVRSQKDQRERAADKGLPPEFVTSAFDEALTTLLLDARPGEEQALVLVSDGRDGYFRELELCEAHPPKACQGLGDGAKPQDRAKLKKCIGDFLDQRIAASQVEFKSRATHWLGLLRAAEIRVFAVGLGSMGRDFELERLRLLAERSGGTWRLAEDEDAVGPAVLGTMAELSGQLVLDYEQVVEDGAERPTQLNLALDVELDPALARTKPRLADGTVGDATPKFRAVSRSAPVAAALTKREQAEALIHIKIAALQDWLGYRTYVWVGRGLLAVVGIAAAALLLLLVLTAAKKLKRKKA